MAAYRAPSARGFSLTELLVTLAIVAILGLISVPLYRDQVQKTRRADGKVALNQAALRLERCYTQFGSYDHEDCEIDSPYSSPEGHYSIKVEREADSYTLTATPKGAQAGDTRCGELTLDNRGVREASGTSPDGCW